MSRLKIRRFRVKPPPQPILDHYCIAYHSNNLHFAPDTVPPLTSRAIFGNDKPLIFDCGSGRGEWLLRLADEYPDHNLIGIELHWKSVWDTVHKLHQASVEHARVVRADLRHIFRKADDHSATAVFVLFPPPRLEGTRQRDDLLNAERIADYQRVLQPDGLLHVATDNDLYFERSVARLEATDQFELLDLREGFEGGHTAFQKRWEAWGITSKRATFRRV